MFDLVEVKVERFEDDSSEDETLIKYASRVKQEPPEYSTTLNDGIKKELDYEPEIGKFLTTRLDARSGIAANDRTESDPDERSAEGDGGAKCDICGGVYRSKQGLSAHKKRIHFNAFLKGSRRSGECAVCFKKYVNRKSLQTHVNKMHLKDNGRGHVFRCLDCGQVFRSRNSLWMHRYHKHSKLDLRTSCAYCGRVLKTPRSHKDHLMKRHPREYVGLTERRPVGEDEAIAMVRPHKCDICGRRYTTLSALRKHAATVHPAAEDARDCPACARRFKTEARLLSHLEAAHSGAADLRKCAECGLIYKNKYSLQHHMHHTHGVRTPLGAGARCTAEEARRYTRRPHAVPLDQQVLPLDCSTLTYGVSLEGSPQRIEVQPEYILP